MAEREALLAEAQRQLDKASRLASESRALLRGGGQTKISTPPGPDDGPDATSHARWFQPMREALLASPDTDAHAVRRPAPDIALEYATDELAALHGTAACMPRGLTRSMEEEFQHNEGGKYLEVFRYVVHEAAQEVTDTVDTWDATSPPLVQDRDPGRAGWTLRDFAERTDAGRVNLTQAEVAAVRLYSSFARVAQTLNNALRTRRHDDIQPWATTICVLTSAIIKLSQLSSPDTTVYSGMPPCTFSALEAFTGRSAGESFLQYGFMPSTLDPVENVRYCGGGKYNESVVWIVRPTFTSRPANISSISMYPKEAELLFPPCTSLEIIAVERLEQLNKWLVVARPHICTMRLYTDSLLYPWSSPNDALTPEEYDMVVEAGRARADLAGSRAAEGKYANDVCELLTGEPKAAALGLEDYMEFNLAERLEDIRRKELEETEAPFRVLGDALDGRCDWKKMAAIEREFRASKETHDTCDDGKTLWDWFDYVAHQAAFAETVIWGNRDTGRDQMRLADFLAAPQATKAKLRLEHVLALRLYTATPVSFALNGPLRNFKRDGATVMKPIRMGGKHPFPVTVTVLNDAIKRLRDTEGKAVVTLWRGLKNMHLKDDSDFLLAGGVEMSSMSTSYDLRTALFYSLSPHSILFKIVTRSFMERGADLEWISCFPEERECLFPPCTFLSAAGRTQKVQTPSGDFTVVEVTPRL